MKLPRALREAFLLLARVGLGAVFLAHGLQKFVSNGMGATAEGFAAMGVPAPALSAWFAALVETVGGAALILGALTPVFALLLAINMIGALVLVHLPQGLWVTDNGYELVLGLAAGALALAAAGAGRFSVDGLLGKRSTDAAEVAREGVLAGR
ncbi:DoxX family membrane protein [Georgenia thermotolerans]|uniref:DoxX family membrane protein n=1 Tax=Georgenia thermotolerans TaxID=527326 RepID=A0A7J5UUV4_9MICO|nr:DoxX family membrane protein [Georgenia thermotolerans]